MPSVLIETRCQRPPLDESELIDAVHQAVVHAFKIPPQDKDILLVCHEPHRFHCPPNKSEPSLYTRVTIDAFSGRSLDAKRALYRRIVDNLSAFDIPADHVKVLLRESPATNWGVRGGHAASDIDLGFTISV